MKHKSILQSLRFLTLLGLMVLGIGNAWGQSSYTITFKTGTGDGSSISTSTACSTIVSGGSDYLSGNVVTATKAYYNGSSGVKLGTSSDAGTLKMNLSNSGQVTPSSIVVRAKRYSSSKATKLSLNGQTAQNLTADFANYTFTGFTSAITYLELKSSKGTSGGAYCWIESITVNYTTKTLSSLAISGTPTQTTYDAGDEFNPAGLKVTGTYDDSSTEDLTNKASWTYDYGTGNTALVAGATSVGVTATVGTVSSEKTTIYGLTVNATKTLIGIKVTGTPAEFWKGDTFKHDGMTVTATWDDESETDVTSESTFSTPDMTTPGQKTITVTYKGETDTYYIDVKTIANTEETAYTITEAIAKYNAGKDLSTSVYVKGTVSAIKTAWSDQYDNITYAISKDGTTTSTQFLLYRCQTNGAAVGDDVIANGTLVIYSGSVQLAAGNSITSITKATTLSIADIVVKKGENITPVIVTNIPSGYSISYTSSNEDVVIADGNELVTGDKIGTATITATISATGYKGATTTFTVTVTSNATLSTITISGDLTKSTYTVGNDFDFSGLTATGTMSDKSTVDLTSTASWTVEPATLTATTTSVTVKATSGLISGTKDYAVTVNKKEATITIANMEIGKTDVNIPISAETEPENASLTYTVTEGEGTVITLSENKISAVAPGTATVKAEFAGNDEYKSAEKSFTVTVSEQSKATYTFSEFTSADNVVLTDLDGFVITLSKEQGTNKPTWNANQAKVYASGSLTVKANNADIKSICFTYNVNANNKGVVPTIDRVAGTKTAGTWNVDTKTWSGSDSEVTFSTSGSAGNVGFTKLVICYVPSSKTETSLAWSASEATVTIDANDNVFPTLTTTPEDLEGVTYMSSNTAIATIATNGTITLVAPGETTITASYAGDETHAEATPVSYTLTVKEAPYVPQPVAEGYESVDFTSVYSSVTTNKEVETYKGTSFMMEFAKPQSSSTPTKYYKTGESVRAYKDNTITITAAENIKYLNIAWTKEKGEDTGVSISGIGTTSAVVTFSTTCSFDKITVSYKSYDRDVTTNRLGTICIPNSFAKPATMTLYNIVGKDDNKIYFAENEDNIEAGKPYLFRSTEANVVLPYVGAAAAEAGTSNGLVGTFELSDIPNDANCYVLSSNKLYLVNQDEFKCGANRAYIDLRAINGGASTKAFSLDFDAETGIINLDSMQSTEDQVIYNLSGQKLNKLQKGINIVNGKKILF